MTARVLMIQGTGSGVGKSLICAGLCRLFADAGLKVAPFKPQNMSNNAAVTVDGGEIGRAQALQALAARRAPVADMNPLLLKPETERGAQVIVQGRRRETLPARVFFRRRGDFMPAVLESFARLAGEADVVIVEGAGSPAEINLRRGDLANMGFAQAVAAPVVVVGDIHRGGVIAALVGTMAVLDATDVDLVEGFIINNFHGDPELFSEGISFIEERTGRPVLGLVPHLPAAARLPAEDTLALERTAEKGAAADAHADTAGGAARRVRIAVLRLSRIANFDDLDPLRHEPGVTLRFVTPGEALPGDADVVILPGSKSTRDDLGELRRLGWDIDLLAHVRRGGHVLGICGGYQMLGRRIVDPQGLEGEPGSCAGLGLLDVETVLTAEKTTRRVRAEHVASGAPIKAYEIHLGRTTGADCARPFARVRRDDGEGWRDDGATSADGRVAGTYLHGAFAADDFRRAWLKRFGMRDFAGPHAAAVDEALEALADHLRRHVNIERLLSLAREPRLP